MAALAIVAPAVTPWDALNMPLEFALALCLARRRLNERSAAAQPSPRDQDRQVEHLPGGRKAIRITSMDSLRDFLSGGLR